MQHLSSPPSQSRSASSYISSTRTTGALSAGIESMTGKANRRGIALDFLHILCYTEGVTDPFPQQRRDEVANTTKRGPKVRKPGTTAKHGTATEYASYGCRCVPCRAAHLAAYKSSREKARARFHAGELVIKHGTNNAYLYYGCRCDECKAAHTKSYAIMEAKRRAKTGKVTSKSKVTASKVTASKTTPRKKIAVAS